MAVDRSEILESERFEETQVLVAHHHGFHDPLRVVNRRIDDLADHGDAVDVPHVLFRALVSGTDSQVRQVGGKRAHVRRNAHLVVVQDHRQLGVRVPGVIQRFVAHAACHCAVAGYGNHVVVLFPEITCARNSERGGDRGAGVSGFKTVVFAFVPLREAGDPSVFPQGRELFIPPRNHFVDIALVADVVDDFVPGGIVNPVHRHGQFHHAEIGSQVSSVLGNGLDQFAPDLGAQRGKLFFIQFFQICRGLDLLKHHLSLPNFS